MPEAALIVPCYNEARRLDPAAVLRVAAAAPYPTLWLVDDGSTDGTAEVLERIRTADPARVRVLRLARNGGKAEAVRAGLLAALAERPALVGYFDADLSTPPGELTRLLQIAAASPAKVVLASRVRLLGRVIERRAHRHYLGRIFATAASLALRLPVYDTQCGAKVFRAGPELARAVERPFRGRWIFDVELLARLLQGDDRVAPVREEELVEVPVLEWRDVGGSKLRPTAMLRSGLQILALLVRLRAGGRA